MAYMLNFFFFGGRDELMTQSWRVENCSMAVSIENMFFSLDV